MMNTNFVSTAVTFSVSYFSSAVVAAFGLAVAEFQMLCKPLLFVIVAFSALMLLVGRPEGRSACKKLSGVCVC